MTTKQAPVQPDFSDVLNEVSADVKEFWRAQRDYALLVASEKAAKAGSSMMVGMITGALVGLVVLMLSMAAAFLIGDRVGSVAVGFLYVGGAYLLLAVLFLGLWKSVIGKRIQLNIINAFHEKD